jgi:hypothetical protein
LYINIAHHHIRTFFCSNITVLMPRKECLSHAKVSTEADVSARESTYFLGNELKLILTSRPQMHGPNIQTMGRVVLSNS